jgi:hypothetical protein
MMYFESDTNIMGMYGSVHCSIMSMADISAI